MNKHDEWLKAAYLFSMFVTAIGFVARTIQNSRQIANVTKIASYTRTTFLGHSSPICSFSHFLRSKILISFNRFFHFRMGFAWLIHTVFLFSSVHSFIFPSVAWFFFCHSSEIFSHFRIYVRAASEKTRIIFQIFASHLNPTGPLCVPKWCAFFAVCVYLFLRALLAPLKSDVCIYYSMCN